MKIRQLRTSMGLSIISGIIIALIGTNVPIISMFVGLAAYPILKIPGYETTGQLVDYGFLWITLNQ